MKQARAERLRVATAGLVVAAAAAATAVWLSVKTDRLERTADNISTEMIHLERVIGYGGFIHAFKNYVLRPEEEKYRTEAIGHYTEALATFDTIEAIIEQEHLEISLEDLRETLSLYRTMLDTALDAHNSGASADTIDDLVRISDEDAVTNISGLQGALRGLLSDRLRTARTWRILNFLAILLSFTAITLVAVYYRRKDTDIERRAMAEVTRARDQLTAVFSAVRSGVIGLDHNRSVVTLNPPARHLLGGMSEHPPFAWPERIRFLDAEALRPLIASADPVNRALAGTDIRGEVHLMSRSGTQDVARHVRISSARINDSASQVAAVVVIDDITDQELARQRIEREQRLDALGQLTGGIAHDFNNVLATILYATELASKSSVNAPVKRLLKRSLASVERGRQLTARLLAFAKRQPGLAASHQLTDVFREMNELLRPLIEERIELHFDPGPSDLSVFCDLGQLENALVNLVLNARDAILRSGKGNHVHVIARRHVGRGGDDQAVSGDIVITVSDDGPGMSRAVRDRATDPFFTTKSDSGGNGLGLSMVYGFVQQANGDLRITSDEVHGTSVQLFLNSPVTSEASSAAKADKEIETGNGETVLVVEDEPELLDMTATVLRDLGYQTVGQPSGSDAWNWVSRGGRYDILLSDVVMPGDMGGFELAQKLREKHPEKPTLLMSGYTGFSASEMGGADMVLLPKPCLPQTLARALRTALRANAAPAGREH